MTPTDLGQREKQRMEGCLCDWTDWNGAASPSSFLLQRLPLCPLLLLLLLLSILLQLLQLLMNLFLFLQKLTLRGYSRRANAVFRMASDQKQFPEAVRGKPTQSSEWPLVEPQSTLRPSAD